MGSDSGRTYGGAQPRCALQGDLALYVGWKGKGKDEDDILDMIVDFRDNPDAIRGVTVRDAIDAVGCVQRVYAMGAKGKGKSRWPDSDNMDAEGTVRDFNDFRRNASLLNLARFALVLQLYLAMETLFARSLLRRHFWNINREVGAELQLMAQQVRQGLVVKHDEAIRWNHKREYGLQ